MFYTVDISLAQELNLAGSDALVYFALVFLTKKRAWKGSSYKLANYSRCGDRMTAGRALDRLIERGLVIKDDRGYSIAQNEPSNAQIVPQIAQNVPNSKESTKENINKKNKSSLSVSKDTDTDGRTDFDLFWSAYAPVGAFRKKKSACKAFFYGKDMCDDWRKLAVERAGQHTPDRDPYWWLADYDFLNNGCTAADEPEVEKPDWLSGEEQARSFQAGTPLATCWNPDTGSYGVVTLSQALKLGLTIKTKLLPKND